MASIRFRSDPGTLKDTTEMARTLLIDDSQVVRRFCRQTLSTMGFEVYEAAHGRAALEVLETVPQIVLILLDWQMPVMDGREFLRELSGRTFDSEPRILVCSTCGGIADIRMALDEGADEFLMKPFTEDILRDKVLEAFAR